MKGIVLAGGYGTRLLPLTSYTSKQLLPVYDKPMIYYSVSTLIKLNISDILIICRSRDIDSFQKLFLDGSQLGLDISYKIQDEPRGIAEAFIIGEDFIGDEKVALILGDNIFFGENFEATLKDNHFNDFQNYIFGCKVDNPNQYGVAKFDDNGNLINIVEKPKDSPSNVAITGLYIYCNDVIKIAKSLQPSEGRGELEITDINNAYLAKKNLNIIDIGKDSVWFDSGTHESLILSASKIKHYEEMNNIKIGSVEVEAFKKQLINFSQLQKLTSKFNHTFQQYICSLQDRS